jgi:type I restriction enzyme S subunit
MTEGPYKLPEGWRWVRLGEVAIVCYGKANPRKRGNIPVIGSGGIYDFTESALVSHPTVIVGRKGSAGEITLMNEPCWPSDTTFYLSWKGELSPVWIFYWLTLRKPSPQGTTATLPSLRREDLERHIIPLPPLAEQRRIVARIEELMGRVREARRLRQEAQKDAERLWQSVLAQTFPRPGSDLPEGWRWVRLGEVCTINPRRPRLQREPGIPTTFVPMSAVDDESGTIVAAEERPFEQVKSGYTYFEENDVLFAKITPCMENGKAAIARGLLGGIGFGSTEFHVLRPHASVVPEWIWLFVRQERFREDAKKSFRGGVGQQRVPQEFLEQYLIPLPPLEEQRRIVAHLQAVQEKINALKEAQAATEAELKRLEQAILEKAFRGEL